MFRALSNRARVRTSVFSLGVLASAMTTAPIVAANEVTAKGSKAFQYREYLMALASSSYAAQLTSCSSEKLLSQGAAVQHVLCDAPAVVQSGECSETCRVLVDFLGGDCIRAVAAAEAQLAADYQSGTNPDENELEGLLTWANAYLINEYLSPELVLQNDTLMGPLLEGLSDSSVPNGMVDVCDGMGGL